MPPPKGDGTHLGGGLFTLVHLSLVSMGQYLSIDLDARRPFLSCKICRINPPVSTVQSPASRSSAPSRSATHCTIFPGRLSCTTTNQLRDRANYVPTVY
ncbi:hypothetical protein OH76DRAFT_1396307 [Lentinus brumalis]|uniref:Uncharacterized protein n=1 Tax=Lentinus brumalis TaxID=2498619 RepID=A0A371DTT1_9APHY|nr:hypothetical protein OH76DRAFT_1396307 [Polyporus brumalis]